MHGCEPLCSAREQTGPVSFSGHETLVVCHLHLHGQVAVSSVRIPCFSNCLFSCTITNCILPCMCLGFLMHQTFIKRSMWEVERGETMIRIYFMKFFLIKNIIKEVVTNHIFCEGYGSFRFRELEH